MEKAVFLDRDGTINEEMGYINHPSRFKMFNYAAEAIKKLNEIGLKVVIITNQSGIARGYFDESLLNEVHKNLVSELKKDGAIIDKIYYCPHHIHGTVEQYKIECDCRKPKPGMLKMAENELNISLTESYLIGDRYNDIHFAQENGLKAILVLSGYGMGEYTYQKKLWKSNPDFICTDLLEAANLICKNELQSIDGV